VSLELLPYAGLGLVFVLIAGLIAGLIWRLVRTAREAASERSERRHAEVDREAAKRRAEIDARPLPDDDDMREWMSNPDE